MESNESYAEAKQPSDWLDNPGDCFMWRLTEKYVSKFPETKESAELRKLDMLETEARPQDSVYVENLSELNSGEMSGGWVELPYRGNLTAKLEEIGAVLPPDQFGNERSEVAVTDVDLNGPLADLGVRGDQWVRVDQLNVVAGVVAGMKHEALAAAGAYIEDQNLNDNLLAVANVALQADGIGWHSFEDGPIDQSARPMSATGWSWSTISAGSGACPPV